MKYNDAKLQLDKLDIPKYISSGKNLQEILDEVKNLLRNKRAEITDLIRYLDKKNIKKYIQNTLNYSINPDIDQQKSQYWILNPPQVSLFGDNKKEPDLITESLVNKEEPNSNKNAENLDSINNNILTLMKNVNEINSQIKKIKGLNNMSSSSKSIKENRQYIDQMLRIIGGDAKTEEVTLNSVLLKDIKDLLIGEYGVQKDISKIINSALILALYGGNK